MNLLQEYVKELLTEAKLEMGQQRLPLDDAKKMAREVIDLLGLSYLDPSNVSMDTPFRTAVAIPVGSIRRNKESVGDIDILSTVQVSRSDVEMLPGASDVSGAAKRIDFTYTPTDSDGTPRPDLRRKINIFHHFNPLTWGAALLAYSGPFVYNVRLRNTAKKKLNGKLSDLGLFDATGELIPTPTERDVQVALNVTERPPEKR